MRNYDEELDAVFEIEEIEPREFPAIRYISEPHGFTVNEGVYEELIAYIPEDLVDKLREVWKKLHFEQGKHVNEVVDILQEAIYDYDDEPTIKSYYDPYVTCVLVNPYYLDESERECPE